MAMFRQRRLKVNLLSFGGVRGFFFGTGPFIREASCFRQTNLHRLPGVNNKNTQREKKNTDEQKASSMFLFFFFLLRESASLVRQKKKKKNVRGPPARPAQVGVGLAGLLRKAPPMITVVSNSTRGQACCSVRDEPAGGAPLSSPPRCLAPVFPFLLVCVCVCVCACVCF